MSETNSKAAIGIHHSRYARDRRELISLMDRMRAAGVSTEIDLPRIAIIGNQSAGKSSLVEAISGIKVPRDSGTCTRCPFEVRIRQADEPWNCKISLRFETREDGKALARIREIPFGDELSSPEKVEGALRRAQLAILNPSVSPHAFVTATEADVSLAKGGQLILGSTNQLSFSSNLICIDIEGPEVTDLAFLDLPGIISNVDEGEDENNIDLIKSMVDRVITGNCLILLTLSMRDDIENQSAMRHARAADPEGKRTIGVLTKADTLQEGEHHRWIQILEGQRAKLSNGYFATKLPGAADLGKNLTFDAAREAEKNFFTSTAPWSTISPDLRRRLGIPHLTSYLSDKLSSYIKTKLPEIRKVVNEGLVETQERINNLPPPPSTDSLSELMQLLQAYRTDLDAYVAGSQGFEALIQEKNRIQYCFANNIRETRPRLYPLTAYEASGSKQNLRRRFKLLDCSDPSEEIELCVDNDDCKNYVLELALDDVTERIERLRTRELPLNIPFSAKSSLMVESTKGWSKITANALDALREPIADVLNDLVEQYFGRYSESGLTAAAKEIVETVSAQLFSETELRLKHLIELETTPFTLNNHYYEATLEKVRADLKQQRQLLDKSESPAKKVAMPTVDVAKATPEQPRDPLPPTPAPSTAIAVPNGFSFTFKEQSKEPEKSKGEQEKLRAALAALAALGYNVQEEDLPKLLPPDEFADELDVMSHVMANWKVAYKRIIDNVPRFVDYDVLQKLPLAVSTAFAQLASGGSNGAAHYLREGLEVQELRSELTTKLTRITEAKQLLSAFGRH